MSALLAVLMDVGDSLQAFDPLSEGMVKEEWRVELETKEKSTDRRGVER